MPEEQATQIMLAVHTQGKAICGVYSKDVAETKAQQVNEYSRGKPTSPTVQDRKGRLAFSGLYYMLNKDLEFTLNSAFRDARSNRHEFMTVEHLLLALLDNESASRVLLACGVELDKIRKELTEFVSSTTPLIPSHDVDRETQPTLGFQRVLQRAVSPCSEFR